LKKHKIFTKTKLVFSRTLGLAQSAIILAAILGAYLLEPFKRIDELSWDMVARYGPRMGNTKSFALLIEVNGLDPNSKLIEWGKVVDIFTALGAEQIIILPFSGRNPGLIKELNSNPKVIIASEIEPDPSHPGKNRFLARDTEAGLQPVAVAALGTHEQRIKRYQNINYDVGSSLVPSLESLAAQRMGLSVLPDKSYGIDFNREKKLPLVAISHVLQGGLSRELVESKIVIIGPTVFRPRDHVSVPISASDRPIGALQYHGFALDTLLSGRPVYFVNYYVSVSIILIIYLLCLIYTQQLAFIGAMVLLTFACSAWYIIFWGVFEATGVLIPGIPIIIVLGATTFSVLQSRTRREEKVIARLLEKASLDVASQFGRKESFSGQDHWSQALTMLDNLIPVTRAVLFELDAKSNKLRPAAFLRCSATELSEKRRDIMRFPYVDPISRDFVSDAVNILSNRVQDERQFLCPISVKGKLLNLWVVGTTKVSPATQLQFNSLFSSVSHKAAELSEKYALLSIIGTKEHWWHVKSNLQEIAVLKLSNELLKLSQWLMMLRIVVDNLNSPIIVFDLFGAPLVYNHAMQEVTREFGIEPVDLEPANLIAHACEMDMDAARYVMQQVLIEGRIYEKTIDTSDRVRRLRVWSLCYQGKERQVGGINIINSQGIVVELISIKSNISNMQVRIRSSVEEAVDKIARNPAFTHVDFVINSNQDSLLAVAPDEYFPQVLNALFILLAEDAKRRSIVSIQIDEDSARGQIIIKISNQGFGIPEESLREALKGSKYPAPGPLRNLRELLPKAFGPQGSFRLDSKIGEGYKVHISLKAVKEVGQEPSSTSVARPVIGLEPSLS